jgi:hypothetical protein
LLLAIRRAFLAFNNRLIPRRGYFDRDVKVLTEGTMFYDLKRSTGR